MRFFCYLLLFLLAIAGIRAQNLPGASARLTDLQGKFGRYRNYSMGQGLSNNSVWTITQDEDGFMWFGTEEGLNRFDGEHFTAFFRRPDGKGLPDNNVSCLVSLPGHRLLVGTTKGLCLLHTRSLVFEPVTLPVSSANKFDLIIWALFRDSRGRCWVGTDTGVHLLDDQMHVIASYEAPHVRERSTTSFFARRFLESPDGTVVVKCETTQGPSWQIIDFQGNKTIPADRIIPGSGALDTARQPYSLLPQGDRTVWFVTSGRDSRNVLNRFDWGTRTTQVVLHNTYSPPDLHLGEYFQLCMLPDSIMLLTPYFGKIVACDLRNGARAEVGSWKVSAPDGKGVAFFVDREDNLWLCPRFEGIYFLSLKTPPVMPITSVNTAHEQLMANKKVAEEWFGFVCRTVGDRQFLGCEAGGLYTMDKENRDGRLVADGLPNLGGFNYVFNIVPGPGDTAWLNNFAGLCWYRYADHSRGSLRTIHPEMDSMDGRFVYRDHYGLIWGRVRNNGVCCYDTRTRQFHHFPSRGPDAPFPLPSATVVTEDKNGDLWFAYGIEERYIVQWRRATGTFVKIEPINTTGLTCTNSPVILADPKGNLWLQNGDGLFVMDLKTLAVQTFGRDNGLITNQVNGFTFDRNGYGWFATPFGLTRYDPRSGALRTFYESDGLLSDYVTNVELLDTARNILLVSTKRGLCYFETEKIGAAPPPPPTYITGLRVSDVATALPESGPLALPYFRNTLRIEFTGIHFPDGSGNRYQYRLDAADQEWREAGTDNFANYLNLPPGKYIFRARSADSDGVWSTQEAVLAITIYPPFWATWTFRLLLIGAFAGVAVWLYRRQIMAVEKREAEKARVRQQMTDLEMRALRSQMNPHFVFNALNSVQHFILNNDTREASRYLTKFARLMRLILENSESPMVPLAREIELLRYYTELENLRFNNRFTFEIEVDQQLNPESVAIPGMLIQPHIENAIWHGLMHKTGPGHLWIRFVKTGDHTLRGEIEDDGVGRARSAEIEKDRRQAHRSTGLANIRHRLELLNAQLADDISLEFQDLHDADGRASGTKVVVQMPMIARTPTDSSTL